MSKWQRVLLAGAVLYLVWHFGRWYEFKQVQAQVKEAYSHSVDTYFFVDSEVIDPFPNLTSELVIVGTTEAGRCFTAEGEQILLHYYPK